MQPCAVRKLPIRENRVRNRMLQRGYRGLPKRSLRAACRQLFGRADFMRKQLLQFHDREVRCRGLRAQAGRMLRRMDNLRDRVLQPRHPVLRWRRLQADCLRCNICRGDMQRERRVHLRMQRRDHAALQRVQGLHVLPGAVHNRLPSGADCMREQVLLLYGILQRQCLHATCRRVLKWAV